MDTYATVISNIVKGQQLVIGPLAIELANHVSGIKIVSEKEVSITGNSKEVITNLVNQYAQLFGQASIEVCKDAVREIKPPVPADQLPEILK